MSLEELRVEARACQSCDLRDGCNQVVLWDGNPQAKLMLVGEGPGQVEDEQGLPFVGPAGQLLDRILEAAHIDRARDVFLTNIIKCRPPGNRNPEPDEAHACAWILEREIAEVRPSLIFCIGGQAANYLVAPGFKITRQRGLWYAHHDIPVMATYHPAYLLRLERYDKPKWKEAKRETWADFQAVIAAMDHTDPGWRAYHDHSQVQEA